ncbi:MAG: winged helix-turn-helix transcriptional regulator [Spirochaetia bacterium]|nr:winged helix-turn-helix transcriptional regulator [Spirochaetia bacterium]
MILNKQKSEIMKNIKERFDEDRCSRVERMLSIMSNPVRFHILCALERESFSVSELVELTGGKLSNVSQQLKMMTLAGYVAKERLGKQSIYTIKDEKIGKLIKKLEELFGS